MSSIDRPTLREWLQQSPFSLALSAGFFGFFAHCGFLSVLESAGLLPDRLSGTSAGALVAAAWASGLDTESLYQLFLSLKRQDFWDPQPGLGLLAGQRFRALLTEKLPVQSFQQCRTPLSLSAHDLIQRQTQVLQTGELVPAIYASCAVPWLFHPIWLNQKLLCDGGLSDRAALKGIPAHERVLLHHLPSRSKWRSWLKQPALIPDRPQLAVVSIETLPSVSPFRLQVGRFAFEMARQEMTLALDQPIALQTDKTLMELA